MKRIVLWLLGTIAAVALMVGYRTSSPPSSPASGTATTTTDGFDGTLVQTKYGPIQIRIIKSGAKITDVVAVVYPSGVPVTDQINSGALPKLRESALATQSAKIDTVSGATATSDGYRESLQAAIDAAG